MTFADLKFAYPPTPLASQQARHTFANGYGVSVVKGPYTYGGSNGLYELAVIGPDGHLDYTTPVTDDVEGHLTPDDVTRLLAQVEGLPAKTVTA